MAIADPLWPAPAGAARLALSWAKAMPPLWQYLLRRLRHRSADAEVRTPQTLEGDKERFCVVIRPRRERGARQSAECGPIWLPIDDACWNAYLTDDEPTENLLLVLARA